MNWEVLLIGLIPLAVWILGSIFRGAEESRENPRQKTAGDGAALKVPRRPASELDRFLDEARRRREGSQKRRPEPTPKPAVVLAPPPVERPPPVEKSPRLPRREEAPPPRPREASSPPRQRETAPARPAREAPPRPVVVPPPAPAPAAPETPLSRVEQPELPEILPQLAGTAGGPRRSSPALVHATAMLCDRNALVAAFILREILDRPLALRPPTHRTDGPR